MTTLESLGIMKIEDIGKVGPNNSPYLVEHIFGLTKKPSKSLTKRKLKILNAVDPVLLRMLAPDEKVYYLSYGVKNSTFDHMFLGWIAVYLNRKIFVFTTKRIIMVKFRGNYKPADLFSEIPYGHIREAKSTLLGSFRVEYSNGRKDLFVGMPGVDRKVFLEIIATMKKSSSASGQTGDVVNLCPHCFAHVAGFPKECQVCKGKFKNPRLTALLSLAFPGLGDIYLGHTQFGVFQVLGGIAVWATVLIPQAATTTQAASSPTLLGCAIVFVMVHGLDSLVTYKTARKGIYPARR
jgi:hypothetical protein